MFSSIRFTETFYLYPTNCALGFLFRYLLAYYHSYSLSQRFHVSLLLYVCIVTTLFVWPITVNCLTFLGDLPPKKQVTSEYI